MQIYNPVPQAYSYHNDSGSYEERENQGSVWIGCFKNYVFKKIAI